jgi:hypothetical protein
MRCATFLAGRAKAMRLILTIGVLISLSAAAGAAPVHRAKLPAHSASTPQPTTAQKGFAVPGWSDAQTRQWIDDATGPRD